MPRYEVRIWKGLPFQINEIMRVYGKNAEEQKCPKTYRLRALTKSDKLTFHLSETLILTSELYHIFVLKARSFCQQGENRISEAAQLKISIPLYFGFSQSDMASLGKITGIRL